MGAPRSNRKSRYNPKSRKAIDRYYSLRDEVRAAVPKDIIGEDRWNRLVNNRHLFSTASVLTFVATFATPDPKKWGQPHTVNPDRDNIDKALGDALVDRDQTIHSGAQSKVWGEFNAIDIHLEGATDDD